MGKRAWDWTYERYSDTQWLLPKEKTMLSFLSRQKLSFLSRVYFFLFRHNVLPIVMGAHPTDYARSAPYRSYIHVDEFESPKELAEYLHRLDRDDDLYNSYFRWKGTGEFINTYFWCRVCAMLHDDRLPKYYKDVNEWWRGEGVCTTNSWREHEFTRSQSQRNTWRRVRGYD